MNRMTLDKIRGDLEELATACDAAHDLDERAASRILPEGRSRVLKPIGIQNLEMPANLAWFGLESERRWYFSGYKTGLFQALRMLEGRVAQMGESSFFGRADLLQVEFLENEKSKPVLEQG